MTQKTIAKADTFVRSFNQPRNIGQNHFVVVDPGHAQIRMQRCKRIIGNLRSRLGHNRQKSRFSRIRHADKPDVGNHFQPQPDPAFFARPARFGITRRLIDRRLELRIAAAAVAAFGNHIKLTGLNHVDNYRFAVIGNNLRPDRNLDDNVVAFGSGLVRTHAVLTARRLKVLVIAKVDQRIQILNRFKINAAAFAAVTAVRPAKLDILFPAERNAAGTAVARLHENLSLIQKFHNRSLSKK